MLSTDGKISIFGAENIEIYGFLDGSVFLKMTELEEFRKI